MISIIGNKFRARSRHHALLGFTFIELMTAIAVLSGGIVVLYKVFLATVDYQHHLACRIYASSMLEQKIALTEQMLRDYKTMPFTTETQQEDVDVGNKPVKFHYEIQVQPIEGVITLYKMQIQASWIEGRRNISISRSAFITSIMAIRG